MSVGSVSGRPDFGAIRQQFESFRSGKTNITKEDLEKQKAEIGKIDSKGASRIDDLIKNFDKIDKNGDGISFKELTSYNKENGIKGPGDSGFSSQDGLPPFLTGDGSNGSSQVSPSQIKQLISQYQKGGQANGGDLASLLQGLSA